MNSRSLLRYGVALLLTGLALLPWLHGGAAAELGGFILCLIAVVIAAWYGGLGPGLFASLLSSFASLYFFLPRAMSADARDLAAGLELAGLLLAALATSWLNGELRSARREVRVAEGELERQLDFTTAITENLGEGVCTFDTSGRLTFANPAAERMLGYNLAELLRLDLHATLHPARHLPGWHEDSDCSLMAVALTGAPVSQEEDSFVRKDGTVFPVELHCSPIHNGGQSLPNSGLHGALLGAVLSFDDITERQRAREALHHQAMHDVLTGHPNRALLLDRLQTSIRAAQRDSQSLGLLLLDLDQFKEVNDTFGHHYGDLLLQQVGDRFWRTLRDSDTVARLGGDEFAVLLPGDDAVGAGMAADKLLAGLSEPFDIEEQRLHVQGSCGVVVFPNHGSDAHTLLRRADVAMYAAKRANTGFSLYSADHDQYSPNRLTLISELRHAIENDELVLYYQPKVDFRSSRVLSVEALVRWQHPANGLMSPDTFIPLAEHTGLIKPLTTWVLNEAWRQCKAWQQAGADIHVAVNISARNLHDPQLLPTIMELISNWGSDAGWLEIEITESAIMMDPDRALQTLERLHHMGVKLSIDDFGTGYSSLAYLKRLPIDEIKIDRSFVMDMATNDEDAFIARSVIELGHNLGMQVVAEGAENVETWGLLATMGCDLAQGYYLSRPIPGTELMEFFDSLNARVELA